MPICYLAGGSSRGETIMRRESGDLEMKAGHGQMSSTAPRLCGVAAIFVVTMLVKWRP